MNRLLALVHPLVLLALAAIVLWMTWDPGAKPGPLPEISPRYTTGPSLERAIAAMGQDPAEAMEP